MNQPSIPLSRSATIARFHGREALTRQRGETLLGGIELAVAYEAPEQGLGDVGEAVGDGCLRGGKPDLDNLRRIGRLTIGSRQAGGKLGLQSRQRVGGSAGHQPGNELAWIGDLIPRHNPRHERVRADRIHLQGRRHRRVYDLVLGRHVRDFPGGGASGFQPAMVRAQSRA
jgi:hypothetical protein